MRAAFQADHFAITLLEAIPDFALVLNRQRQIITANSRLLQSLGAENSEALLGLRCGDVLHCAYVEDSPNGCGTGTRCISCGAVNAMLEALRTRATAERETRLLNIDGSMELLVQATFVTVDPHEFLVVVLRDLARRSAARCWSASFFTMCSTIGGVLGLSEYLLEAGPRS